MSIESHDLSHDVQAAEERQKKEHEKSLVEEIDHLKSQLQEVSIICET